MELEMTVCTGERRQPEQKIKQKLDIQHRQRSEQKQKADFGEFRVFQKRQKSGQHIEPDFKTQTPKGCVGRYGGANKAIQKQQRSDKIWSCNVIVSPDHHAKTVLKMMAL